MKSTGIVRNIDDLGRITLPRELHRTLGFEKNQPIEIFVSGTDIVLRKYVPGCTLCGSTDMLQKFRDKLICSSCVIELNK